MQTFKASNMHCVSHQVRATEWSESTSSHIKDGGQCQNWKWLSLNKSAMDCSVLLKFGLWVHYGFTEAAQWLRSNYGKIQDGWSPNW